MRSLIRRLYMPGFALDLGPIDSSQVRLVLHTMVHLRTCGPINMTDVVSYMIYVKGVGAVIRGGVWKCQLQSIMIWLVTEKTQQF